MQIAVLSDIHDHIWNFAKVAAQIKGKVKTVIFCGDMCAPFMAGLLGEINLPIYACLGNVDEDHIAMQKRGGKNFTWVGLTEEFGQVTLGSKKIAFCHYPKLAELLAKSGDYDAVCFGHTHVAVNKPVGNTLLLNPGAVCGIQDGKPGIASYALYDTSTHKAQIIKL